MRGVGGGGGGLTRSGTLDFQQARRHETVLSFLSFIGESRVLIRDFL